MKVNIIEDGKDVGWYNAEKDKYKYDGKYTTVETILNGASNFTDMDIDMSIDDGIVGGEKHKEANKEEKIRQVEHLLDSYKDIKIKKSKINLLQIEDGIVSKRKVYVDGPNDGPDDVDVQESEHNEGVYYYETRARDDDGSLVSDDEREIPTEVDPSGGERQSVRRSGDDQSGRYADSMDVVSFEDGSSVYVKQAEPGHMISVAMSDTVLNSLGVNAPKTAYDPEGTVSNIDSGDGVVYSEGIQGNTIGQLTGAAYNLPGMTPHYEPDDLNEDSYTDAVAGMIITGNDDLNSGNMIIDEEGEFWIIDNDNLGERNMQYDPQEANYIAESAESYANSLGIEFDLDELEQRIQEIAQSVWDDEDGAVNDVFLDNLQQAEEHGIDDGYQNATEAIKENLLMNIEAAANGDIDLGGGF